MSKKRLNYDDPRWQGMVWANPLNMKSGSYLNDYVQSLDAMRANALNATTGDVRKGKAFSQVDAMKAQMEYAATLEERAYNEYLYNQYESPEAMVRQYEEAGLNPMMLAGGNSVGGSVNSTGSNSMSLGRGTESARGLDIMSMILNAVMGAAGQVANFKNSESQRISANANAAKSASDVAVNNAEIAKKEAETNLLNKQAEGLDIDINWKDKMYDINYKVLVNTNNLKELEYKYESVYGWRVREAELDKMASEIEVNKAEFNKLTADAWRTYQITPAEVNQINAMVDKINSDKAMVDLEQAGQILERVQRLAVVSDKNARVFAVYADNVVTGLAVLHIDGCVELHIRNEIVYEVESGICADARRFISHKHLCGRTAYSEKTLFRLFENGMAERVL